VISTEGPSAQLPAPTPEPVPERPPTPEPMPPVTRVPAETLPVEGSPARWRAAVSVGLMRVPPRGSTVPTGRPGRKPPR
jgi:hypothetical protein